MFATDILNGMNLAQVSASTICAALHDAVDRSGGDHAAEVEEIVDEEKVDTFVRISRNAGKRKRAVLVRCGLHWHGRDGGWTGRVGDATLTKLRDVFGDKVEKPPLIAPGESPLPAQKSAAAPAGVDEEPVTVQSQPDIVAAEGFPREATTSTPVHRNPLFRSFPPRRPAQQQAEEPS